MNSWIATAGLCAAVWFGLDGVKTAAGQWVAWLVALALVAGAAALLRARAAQ